MKNLKSHEVTVKDLDNDIVHVDPLSIVAFCDEQISALDKISCSHGAYHFKWQYLRSNVMSKYFEPGVSDPVVLRNAAFASFQTGEDSCASLNAYGVDISASHILDTAAHYVKTILGAFSYDKVLKGCKHGNGATAIRTRAFGPAHNKYVVDEPRKFWSSSKRRFVHNPGTLACTPLAYKYWAALNDCSLLGKYGDLQKTILVRGNVLWTVPKNNKTDRTIAKEPCVNMFLQLGVGSYLSARLKLFNNSKYDQTRNQRLARKGSIDGTLATIDLSRASDSISFWLVARLLPPEWLQYLDDIRSHYYRDPQTNEWKRYEKFCTMGNGFCFELQTILFLALSLAVSGDSLKQVGSCHSTYGDDIICPSQHAQPLIDILSEIGFVANADKTFITGAFRESCGKHYYNGVDVTPFYIRKPIDSIERVCWLLNSLRKWAYCDDTQVCDDSVWPLWSHIYKSHKILRKLRGGRDVQRIDYVVTPGRPAGRLVTLVKKLVVPELPLYICTLIQGVQGESRDITGYTRNNDGSYDFYNSYHYTIHPESDTYESLSFIKNEDEVQMHPTKYIFLTEIQ